MPDNDEIMKVDLVFKCIKKNFRDENLINHLLQENEMKQKLFFNSEKFFINLW